MSGGPPRWLRVCLGAWVEGGGGAGRPVGIHRCVVLAGGGWPRASWVLELVMGTSCER